MLRYIIPLALVLAIIPAKAQTPGRVDPSVQPTPSWIWKNAKAGVTERVFFRREFQLPAGTASAVITSTCDNWHNLVVNGKSLGIAGDWQNPRTYDVMPLLRAGAKNVIAVEARNEGGDGGMALRFRVTLKDGKKLYIVSDPNWLCSSEAGEGWQTPEFKSDTWTKAAVVMKMGEGAWGNVIPEEAEPTGDAKDVTADYKVAKDFKLEKLYQVPGSQGSWVAMTVDGNGRLICADQYGKIYRMSLSTNPQTPTAAEPLDIPLQGAHGLLWHDGVLWVMVNEGDDQSGIWRVAAGRKEGDYARPELVKKFPGRGEHGPHGMTPSPDGKSIYVVAGNFTDLAEVDSSLVSTKWAEDQLLPRRPDARGHAHDRMAPGGWVARFTTDGKNFQLFASGLRNSYDLAFNDQGELFTYDSDMEWDLGMPWYRPTRICHVVPGAEFGWRNGTGPWPPYYEDSMPPLVEIGPGSPTGLVSGAGAKFPAKYQRGIYAIDWTFATMYVIHLTPDGAGYKAVREEFISGSGLPMTDAVIGKDGAMYFLTGGRRTESALWRVTYRGRESTAPAPKSPPLSGPIAEAVSQDRTMLQALVTGKLSTDAARRQVDFLWTQLGSPNRLQRYSARLVLEQVPVNAWGARLTSEKDAWRIIGGALGVARTGNREQTTATLEALNRVEWAKLDKQQQLNWLRAVGLVFARTGEPTEEVRKQVIAKIDKSFPAKDDYLNRELCRLLSYLAAPGVVSRTLTLMDTAGPSPAPDWLDLAKRNASYGKTVEAMIANLPPAQVIHYIYCLRVVKGPWHADERKRFFGWLAKLGQNSGGESYAGFIDDLRKQTLDTCTQEERQWIEKLDTGAPPNPFANLPTIKGPGQEWTIDEVVKLAESGLEGRDHAKGKDMFRASLCAACHRFGNEGGSAGPDLSSLGSRFSVRDIAESILEPSKVVSDQYAFDLIIRNDGSEVTGKIIEEKDEKWIVATTPFDFSQTIEVERNNIKELKHSPFSPMPPALINRLNAEELKDLLAYLLDKK